MLSKSIWYVTQFEASSTYEQSCCEPAAMTVARVAVWRLESLQLLVDSDPNLRKQDEISLRQIIYV